MPPRGYGDAREAAAWLSRPVAYIAVTYTVPVDYLPLVMALPSNTVRPRLWPAADALLEQVFKGRPPGVYALHPPDEEEIKAHEGNRDYGIRKEFAPAAGTAKLYYRTFQTDRDAFAWFDANKPTASDAACADPAASHSTDTPLHESKAQT